MKKNSLILFIALFFLSLQVNAQSYEQLWKEVAEWKRQDLPRSVIEKTEEIYRKAQAENNMPQMLAAFISQANGHMRLSMDSIPVQKAQLFRWADSESSVLARSVLNVVAVKVMVADGECNIEQMLRRVSAALQHKDTLFATSAATYLPVVTLQKNRQLSCLDNMYDLLAREIISSLVSNWSISSHAGVQKAIIGIYDTLIGQYTGSNPAAALLASEAKLMYQYRYTTLPAYYIDAQQVIAQLQQLIDQYSNLDICYDTYVKLAMVYQRQNQSKEAAQVLYTAAKQYRRGEAKSVIDDNIRCITSPYAVLNFGKFYPGTESDMEITYKNLQSFTLETYQLQLHPSSALLADAEMNARELIRKEGKKIASEKYHLSDKQVYSEQTAHLKYQVPQSGVYLLKFIPHNHSDGVAYRLLYISPYECISIVQNNQTTEMIAVDATSGRPVGEVEFVFYRKLNNNYEKVKTVKADSHGSILVDHKDTDFLYYHICNRDTASMELQMVYRSSAFSVRRKNEREVHHHLFTDRSIYRPGQVVHLSGVRYEKKDVEVHTVAGAKVNVRLVDSNYQTVKECQLVTDEFGGYTTDFVLPQTVLPGTFRLYAGNSSTYIKVEEYKRPTFCVTFQPYGATYNYDDTITVSGMATAFSGAPLRLAKVKYKVVRYHSWMWMWNREQETQLLEGETLTDTNGKFSVEAVLSKPETTDERYNAYYTYIVAADVTSGNGETQQGEARFSIGRQSIALQLQGWKESVAKEDKTPVCFRALNLDRQPIQVEVGYEVFTVNDKREKIASVLKGKAESNRSFIPSAIYNLPSGRYVVDFSATDAQHRESTATFGFTLFSLADHQPPYATTMWFYHSEEQFDADRPVDVYVGTSESDAYLLVDLFNSEGHIGKERIKLNNEVRKFSFSYQPEYGKGLKANFALYRDGRLFTRDVYLQRPAPDKQLHLKWNTFRNHLLPGQQEEWILKITDKEGRPADAALLASMYDASLNQLFERRHNYSLHFGSGWWSNDYIHASHSDVYMRPAFKEFRYNTGLELVKRGVYNQLMHFGDRSVRVGDYVMMARPMLKMAMNNSVFAEADVEVTESGTVQKDDTTIEVPDADKQPPVYALRENFNETAFFYPQLRTDSLGCVSIAFTLPDALTEWDFMAYAHTRDMDYGVLNERIRVSKPFMVQPNMPRFVRTGDHVIISASLVNMSDQPIEGRVVMTLLHPLTQRVVYTSSQGFKVGQSATGQVDFDFRADAKSDVLVCRIEAHAGDFSDGEQHYLPVLSDRMVVTESVPIQLEGKELTKVAVNHLFNNGSRTASRKRMVVEMTAHPDWYAVQALPFMSAPHTDNALSWAGAYYANAVAQHIVHAHPRIRHLMESWKMKSDGASFVSELEKHPQLKQILLEESPWLMDARTASEQRSRIKLLFDLNAMGSRQSKAIDRLSSLQLADGSWSWFKGMKGNLFITTHVIEYMARLKSMGIGIDAKAQRMYERGLSFLTTNVRDEWKQKQQLEQQGNFPFALSETTLRYLYICALDSSAQQYADLQLNQSLIAVMKGKSNQYTIYGKSLMAIVMHAHGAADEAQRLLASLRQYALYNKEMGRYFDGHNAYYSWYANRIPTHVVAMEAIELIDPNDSELAEMKQWLLKQKQVQHWGTTPATADAVHAFLCTGKRGFSAEGSMKAVYGKQTIVTPDDALGYVCAELAAGAARQVEISHHGEGMAWATLYAQCTDKLENIKSFDGKGLGIVRRYIVNGKEIHEGEVLHVGDRVTVRIVVSADRDMDFIQVKDSRAACMAPVEQMSGYRWASGTGYYYVSRDASTQLFIDRLRKGTHQMEYEVMIDRKGEYQLGTASVQSAYSPQFASHTDGLRITVK